ncbi:hypothetical protein [Citromicrobium bathyomarinum]|uniref:hypothetical protein n=1 Tax=Citromicrobium bathyomarinum TaxID=72174 RepID=UPI0002FFB379|nr:hypothetical protein [Citromicrobium bathyomarinum]
MKFGEITDREPSVGYRNYALGIFAVVHALNFIDRQIISVLALDLQRDLGLSEADLGFLYGTTPSLEFPWAGSPIAGTASASRRSASPCGPR